MVNPTMCPVVCRSGQRLHQRDMMTWELEPGPPTKHDDFEMFLTCDNVPKLPLVREQIRNQEYWEFGLKYWGQIRVCEYSEIAPETTTHYLFKSNKPYVREIFEQIEWSRYVSNMGAPNVGGKSLVIKAYTEKKRELGIKDWLKVLIVQPLPYTPEWFIFKR